MFLSHFENHFEINFVCPPHLILFRNVYEFDNESIKQLIKQSPICQMDVECRERISCTAVQSNTMYIQRCHGHQLWCGTCWSPFYWYQTFCISSFHSRSLECSNRNVFFWAAEFFHLFQKTRWLPIIQSQLAWLWLCKSIDDCLFQSLIWIFTRWSFPNKCVKMRQVVWLEERNNGIKFSMIINHSENTASTCINHKSVWYSEKNRKNSCCAGICRGTGSEFEFIFKLWFQDKMLISHECSVCFSYYYTQSMKRTHFWFTKIVKVSFTRNIVWNCGKNKNRWCNSKLMKLLEKVRERERDEWGRETGWKRDRHPKEPDKLN